MIITAVGTLVRTAHLPVSEWGRPMGLSPNRRKNQLHTLCHGAWQSLDQKVALAKGQRWDG